MNRRDFLKLTGSAVAVATIGTHAVVPTTSTAEPEHWAVQAGRDCVDGYAAGVKRGQLVYVDNNGMIAPVNAATSPNGVIGIATRDIAAWESVSIGMGETADVLTCGVFNF